MSAPDRGAPPLSDVLAHLFAQAQAEGEYADALLSRGLHLRASPDTPRRLMIWRAAGQTPPSPEEALACAQAAGFPGYETELRGGGRALVLTEKAVLTQEQRDAERYRRRTEPVGPFRPGRSPPGSGELERGRLYGLERPGGYVTFLFSDQLWLRGPTSARAVPLFSAARWLARLGYRPNRLLVGGRIL